jgi:hypothetical protein
MDQGPFEDGYIAGWRSVKGAAPPIVPRSPMLGGTDAYMVGFSRGRRDADAHECVGPDTGTQLHP